MDILSIANALICLLLCGVIAWLILSPKIADGIVIKAGLIMSAMGLLGCALILLGRDVPEWRALMAAWLLFHVGGLVVLGGLVLRIVRDPVAREVVHAVSGWPPLDDKRAVRHG